MVKLRNKRYVIALSFGNYLKKDGGTDKVIIEHSEILAKAGISYIQIAPIGARAEEERYPSYSIVIDGVLSNVVDEYGIAKLMNSLSLKGYELNAIFIHHVKKFKLNFLKNFVNSTIAPVYFYIHDYYTICKQEQLLKDGKTFCGVGSPCEEKCKGCEFDNEGTIFRKKLASLLEMISDRLTVVAPSTCAKNIWMNAYPTLSKNTVVVPHQILKGKYHNNDWTFEDINIAYIGKLIPQKGSDVWDKIIKTIHDENLPYNEYYLGISDFNNACCKNIPVSVDKNHLDAMTVALRDNNIQIVVLWSTRAETYAYTYYEALAANCFILTSALSGNIRDEVERKKNGKIFDSESELLEYICDFESVKNDVLNFWELESKNTVPLDLIPNDEWILKTVMDVDYKISFKVKYSFLSSVRTNMVKFLYLRKYK